MKNVLRVIALGVIVSAAMLPNAHAGACSVQCNNGQSWYGSTATAAACCTMISTFCHGQGGATYNGIKCDPAYWTE